VTESTGVAEGVAPAEVTAPAAQVVAPVAPTRNMASIAALVLGGMCLLLWLGGFVAPFAGLDTDESSIVATIVLLVVMVLAAVATVPARSVGTVIACAGAIIYGGIWTYLRVGFDKMMPDALAMVITLVFFVAPLVTGVAALTVGMRRRRA